MATVMPHAHREASMAGPLIAVRDLTKTYHLGSFEVRALRGVSLDVQAGEFMAITGPSGLANQR